MAYNKKTEFKFLCINHEVCEEVRNTLDTLGFKDLKDLKNSASYDIAGNHESLGREKTDKLVHDIFEKTGRKIVSIKISNKD